MIIYLLAVFVMCTVRTSPPEHLESQLQKRLFKGYVPRVRPVVDYNKSIIVTVGLSLRKIQHLDEIRQSFKTTVNIHLYWKDELLIWNATKYRGISNIEFPYDKNIWTPDLLIYNALETPGEIGMKDAFVRLYNSGQVFLWTQSSIDTACDIRTKQYPFDVQTCQIVFSKFTSSDKKVKLTILRNDVDMSEYVDLAEWKIIKTQATTEMIPYYVSFDVLEADSEIETLNYTFIRYTLTMKRSCRLCLYNVITPVLVLATLNMLTFFVPSECGEKTSFPISIFLTLAVFLTIITQSLPESVDGVSYLSTYVTFQLSISALTLFSAVIALHLHYKKGRCRVSKHLYFLFSALRCDRSSTPESKQNESEHSFVPREENVTGAGNFNMAFSDVSYAFDRIMFMVIIMCQSTVTVIFIVNILN